MGKIVEEKKKKKGRPSLLDLQKRNLLREQQQQQLQQQHASSSDRRIEADGEDNDDDERTEKKLKLLVRLPPPQTSYLNSTYNNNNSISDSSILVDDNGENPLKKRKFNDTGDGSDHPDAQKGDLQNFTSKAEEIHMGTPLQFGPTTCLPDKKLLFFILDRLQKKDTYSVFSEPVDPEELPDYHDIIHNPMDFGTVRKKLDVGEYLNLEQLEADVLLICSNAMEYNAPDTIYFRQARSIQELAKKNFENLRHGIDGNEPPQPKRRGRPPKYLKRPPENVGTAFSSDATTPATDGDKTIWSNTYNLRKGHVSAPTDGPGRTYHGSRSSEAIWSGEHKSERNDEFSGSVLKGMSFKFVKKNVVLDENRRNTYRPFHQPGDGCEPSVFSTFHGEKKQLMPVGLHMEHGYARSLARFAANLGPVAWKVASKKIAMTLPAGVNFGPGWVGVEQVSPVQLPLLTSSSPQLVPHQEPISLPTLSSSGTPAQIIEPRDSELMRQEIPDKAISDILAPRSLALSSTIASSLVVASKAPESIIEDQLSHHEHPSYESRFGLMNNSSSGIGPSAPFQIHRSPGALNPALNGFSGGFGFNLEGQMVAQMVKPGWQGGNLGLGPQVSDPVSCTSLIHSVQRNLSDYDEHKRTGASSPMNSSMSFTYSRQEVQGNPGAGTQAQTNCGVSSQWQRADSVPPDLNARFQLPGSPSSSVRLDSSQPDLALQL